MGDPLALLRDVPAVDRVLGASSELISLHGRTAVTREVRLLLDQLRADIREGNANDIPPLEDLISSVHGALDAAGIRSLRPVYNLTGTVLHTNLGRAVLPGSIRSRLEDILFAPSNVEFLHRGPWRTRRSSRTTDL